MKRVQGRKYEQIKQRRQKMNFAKSIEDPKQKQKNVVETFYIQHSCRLFLIDFKTILIFFD